MVRHMELIPDDNPDPLGVPDSVLIRPTLIAVFDNIEDQITLVTPVRPTTRISPAAAYDQALERLGESIADLDRSLPHGLGPAQDLAELPEPVSNMTREQYHAAVERAKEYIRAGDVFQVVPSQRFTLPFTLPPFSLYRSLRRLNPSPFLYYLELDGFAIVGSSPEILVRLRNGEVTIRPIAGTRRRGATPEEDKALAEDLLADPKERAEQDRKSTRLNSSH